VRKLRFVLIAAIATLAIAASTLPAAASTQSHASPASSATASHSLQAVEYRITTKYGTLTYGWRPSTGKPDAVSPDSADGCNQNVCIDISGSGLTVNDWTSTALYGGPGEICTQSYFYENDAEIRQGTYVCGEAGTFFTDWDATKVLRQRNETVQPMEAHPG
jgi:hypothetical protein